MAPPRIGAGDADVETGSRNSNPFAASWLYIAVLDAYKVCFYWREHGRLSWQKRSSSLNVAILELIMTQIMHGGTAQDACRAERLASCRMRRMRNPKTSMAGLIPGSVRGRP